MGVAGLKDRSDIGRGALHRHTCESTALSVEEDPQAYDSDKGERQLLRRLRAAIRKGDTAQINSTFEIIYNTYVHLVAFVCARYLEDDTDIRSVTNEVFISFFNHADSIKEDGGLKYYLTTAARHAAINHLRSLHRHYAGLAEVLPCNEQEDDPLTLISDPAEEDMGASLRYRELVRELASILDPLALDIVLSHAVTGESFPDIGARLGKKPTTVKTIYHRALSKFRQEKGDHWK